jgi:hypothetical protein
LGLTLQQAVETMSSTHPMLSINDGFKRQLMQYEVRVRGEASFDFFGVKRVSVAPERYVKNPNPTFGTFSYPISPSPKSKSPRSVRRKKQNRKKEPNASPSKRKATAKQNQELPPEQDVEVEEEEEEEEGGEEEDEEEEEDENREEAALQEAEAQNLQDAAAGRAWASRAGLSEEEWAALEDWAGSLLRQAAAAHQERLDGAYWTSLSPSSRASRLFRRMQQQPALPSSSSSREMGESQGSSEEDRMSSDDISEPSCESSNSECASTCTTGGSAEDSRISLVDSPSNSSSQELLDIEMNRLEPGVTDDSSAQMDVDVEDEEELPSAATTRKAESMAEVSIDEMGLSYVVNRSIVGQLDGSYWNTFSPRRLAKK